MSQQITVKEEEQNTKDIDLKDKLDFIFKTIIWIFYSYLIPVINIVIIVLVHNNIIEEKLQAILSIVVATNTCFILSIITILKQSEKNREKSKDIATFILIISSVFFGIMTLILEINIQSQLITKFSYYSSIAIFTISVILCFIGKWDEWEASREERESIRTANKSKKNTSGTINGQDVKI